MKTNKIIIALHKFWNKKAENNELEDAGEALVYSR